MRDLNHPPPLGQTWQVITAADAFINLDALEKIIVWAALPVDAGERASAPAANQREPDRQQQRAHLSLTGRKPPDAQALHP